MNTEDKEKGGRPKIISDEVLKEKLLEYKNKIRNKKFTYSDLEREYGIKRHIWRDRKDIKALFEKYNEVDIGLDGLDLLKYDIELLPNLEEILDEKNGARRQKAVSQYSDFVNGLYNRCVEYHQYKKQFDKLNAEYTAVKDDKTPLEKELDYYKKEYFKLVAQSQNTVMREKNGIKKNVIEFDKSEFESDFEDYF